jgi:hypothetical protein
MSTQDLRITLNAVDMPFLYRDAPRATLLPGLDQVSTRIRNQLNPDWNSPALLYCENVVPIARGVISTQLADRIPPDPTETDFDQAITLRDRHETNTLFVPAKGKNYVLDITTGTWNSSLPFTATFSLVTRGYTQGRTFIFYEKEKLFEYDGAGGLIDRTSAIVFPSGFAITDIRGIGAASNYLLLFTDIDVLWSSPTDPLNFDRATSNGSGYQTPQDARGQISCILPVSGGAIIYTVRNAVGITFTNNAATPFVFRGIPNSGGVAGYEQVAYDADEKFQYVWGSGGLQQIALNGADGVFPEVSDFLTAGRYETYNYTTHRIEETKSQTYFTVKLTYVGQRFLVVSYGPVVGGYTYALIYDTQLQRWGKVKVTHVDAFNYPYPNISGDLEYDELFVDYTGLGLSSYEDLGIGVLSTNPPKKSIAFLNSTGAVQILVMDYAARSQTGVAVFGQIQHNRNNDTTLQGVELEGVDAGSLPRLFALISLNGKTTDRAVEYPCYEVADEYRNHLGREVGRNINLAVEGAFQLTGLLVKVAKHGRTG